MEERYWKTIQGKAMGEEGETTEQTEGNITLTVGKTERALKGVYKSSVKTKEKWKHL